MHPELLELGDYSRPNVAPSFKFAASGSNAFLTLSLFFCRKKHPFVSKLLFSLLVGYKFSDTQAHPSSKDSSQFSQVAKGCRSDHCSNFLAVKPHELVHPLRLPIYSLPQRIRASSDEDSMVTVPDSPPKLF